MTTPHNYSQPIECKGDELRATVKAAKLAGYHTHRMSVIRQAEYKLEFYQIPPPTTADRFDVSLDWRHGVIVSADSFNAVCDAAHSHGYRLRLGKPDRKAKTFLVAFTKEPSTSRPGRIAKPLFKWI